MPKDPQGNTITGVSFKAKIAPDGTPFIEGLLTADLPAGIKFIGNGTCTHPLNVQLSGEYASESLRKLRLAREILDEVISADHLTCNCEAEECTGNCLRGQANQVLH